MSDSDTPRTDEALRLHYLEWGTLREEATKEAYEFARELEREINELTTLHIELVNHLELYSTNRVKDMKNDTPAQHEGIHEEKVY